MSSLRGKRGGGGADEKFQKLSSMNQDNGHLHHAARLLVPGWVFIQAVSTAGWHETSRHCGKPQGNEGRNDPNDGESIGTLNTDSALTGRRQIIHSRITKTCRKTLVKDRSSIIWRRGEGYEMRELWVQDFLCAPPPCSIPSRLSKTFCNPPLKLETCCAPPPPSVWLKLQAPMLKLPLNYCAPCSTWLTLFPPAPPCLY